MKAALLNRMTRRLRHVAASVSSSACRRLTPSALSRLQQRIAASETLHTGQIRVYAESSLPWSYLLRDATARERAITLFGKLRVWDTEHNNGVLIYLLMAEHAIEIVADRGLNRHVGPERWNGLLARMRIPMQEGHCEEGLLHALDEVSALLERHFPSAPGVQQRNELPNAPIIR